MLTSRGVHRLSRRALNSAKRTNAFFSTAAAANVVPRAACLASTSQAHARPARASPQAGPSFNCGYRLPCCCGSARRRTRHKSAATRPRPRARLVKSRPSSVPSSTCSSTRRLSPQF
ncbi:hypothetical protein EIP86_004389 [Pleurotus ostreatoroseus]|nr:hypothetical protein EIP86_004389 [Pleurotus ostreatoroseus]